MLAGIHATKYITFITNNRISLPSFQITQKYGSVWGTYNRYTCIHSVVLLLSNKLFHMHFDTFMHMFSIILVLVWCTQLIDVTYGRFHAQTCYISTDY